MNGEMINSYEQVRFNWEGIPKELKCLKKQEWQITDNENMIYCEGKLKNMYAINQMVMKYAKVHKINMLEASRAVLKELRAKNKLAETTEKPKQFSAHRLTKR